MYNTVSIILACFSFADMRLNKKPKIDPTTIGIAGSNNAPTIVVIQSINVGPLMIDTIIAGTIKQMTEKIISLAYIAIIFPDTTVAGLIGRDDRNSKSVRREVRGLDAPGDNAHALRHRRPCGA